MNQTALKLSFFTVLLLTSAFMLAEPEPIEHVKVYYEDGRFAAWPSNNGIWTWGEEILIGFVGADYQWTETSLHTYDRSSARHKYARSLDGGLTWSVADAYQTGQTARAFDHELSDEEADWLTPEAITVPCTSLAGLIASNSSGKVLRFWGGRS